MRSINVGFANGAELGLKIDENFKESDMVTFLKNYADQNEEGRARGHNGGKSCLIELRLKLEVFLFKMKIFPIMLHVR